MHPADITLNAYVDGELAAAERGAVAEHLEHCGTCRAVVDELSALVQEAARLGVVDPTDAMWDRIARRRSSFGRLIRRPPVIPGWLATAALIVIATAAGFHLAPSPPDATGRIPARAHATAPISPDMSVTYERAIAGLDDGATNIETVLGPSLGVKWRNDLSIVDAAIADSRAALARDPDNAVARHSLIDGLSTKADVLQTAAAIVSMQASNERGH
jgi:anti-sigma factor RsiW